MYFKVLLNSLASAAAPAILDVWFMYELHRVSAMVVSDIKHLPFFHVVRVKPSGRFPSFLDKFEGSLTVGIFA